MEKYRITLKTHWSNGWQIIGYAIISVIGVIVANQIRPEGDPNLAMLVFGIGFLLQLVPLLAIHTNYYFANRGDILLIDRQLEEMYFFHEGVEIRFRADDVDRVVVYKSPALKRKDIQILSWDGYNHIILWLKDGSRVVVTSLLASGKVTFPIQVVNRTTKVSLFRWVAGRSFISDARRHRLLNDAA
jgi:hypothetical protein